MQLDLLGARGGGEDIHHLGDEDREIHVGAARSGALANNNNSSTKLTSRLISLSSTWVMRWSLPSGAPLWRCNAAYFLNNRSVPIRNPFKELRTS